MPNPPDPVAFTVFGIDIMWYAVMITSGMIIAAVICCRRAPKHHLTVDQMINFMIFCIPAAIIGARLYYVIFNWSMYSGDLASIFNTRAGGLAIHGGLILGLSLIHIFSSRQRPGSLGGNDMCIAIPGKVLELSEGKAKVDFNGNTVDVNTGLVEPQVGQYVLVHAGCAIEVMEHDKAQELMELFTELEELQ